ncbi:MAG TPA: DUF72 domain-containing protein, partial [Polyangiaceae bacterium]|nr:DUF72 domain-containing protein [Polyangiaceae bacterium]
EAYAERLPTVEINNTFYRMPDAKLLEGFRDRVPEGFTFSLKAPRSITHSAKLRNVESKVQQFVGLAQLLGTKLGPLLFQLPPFLKKDLALLTDFASILPKGVRAALEFRHPSWFDDEVYETLRRHALALVATEVDEGDGIDSPYVATAPFGYVRLRRQNYDAQSLKAAARNIENLRVEPVFAYFKHEVLGPGYADQLARIEYELPDSPE